MKQPSFKSLASLRSASGKLILGALAVAILAGFLGWRWFLSGVAHSARRALADGRLVDADAAADRWLRLSGESGDALLLKARIAIARDEINAAYALILRAKARGAPMDQARLASAILGVKAGYLAESEPTLAAAFAEPHEPDPQLDEALARVYLERFDLSRASAVIKSWMADAPRDAKPYLWRAEIDQRHAGSEGELIVDYREALGRDPKLAKARFGLAEVLRSLHRSEEAAAEYAAYLELRPDDAAGEVGAGRSALELGDAAAARRHFDRAIALDPKDPRAYKQRADAALHRGEAPAALADLDRAASLDPFDAEIRYTRALALTRLGRPDDAKAERANAKRLQADNEHLATLQGRLVQAPQDRDLQGQVARWLYDHGHPAEGVRWAEKILKEQPDHPAANRLLGDHHQGLGNIGLANYYKFQVGTDPKPPEGRSP